MKQTKISNLKFGCLVAVFMLLVSFQGNVPQQPKTVTITLTVEEAEIVLKGCSKLPYEESAAVIQKIQTQAVAQLNPPQKQDSTDKRKN